MINVKSIIYTEKVFKQNISVLVVNTSPENAEEFELPSNYYNCAVRYGSFEYNGNTVNTYMNYFPEMTKINISANSEIFIFLRNEENS